MFDLPFRSELFCAGALNNVENTEPRKASLRRKPKKRYLALSSKNSLLSSLKDTVQGHSLLLQEKESVLEEARAEKTRFEVKSNLLRLIARRLLKRMKPS
jgi:hypothetical protein